MKEGKKQAMKSRKAERALHLYPGNSYDRERTPQRGIVEDGRPSHAGLSGNDESTTRTLACTREQLVDDVPLRSRSRKTVPGGTLHLPSS